MTNQQKAESIVGYFDDAENPSYYRNSIRLIAAALDEKDAALEQLRASKDEAIRERDERLAAGQKIIDEMRGYLWDKDAEIARLKAEVTGQRHLLDELHSDHGATIAAREATITDLRGQLDKAEKVIEENGYAFQEAQNKTLAALSEAKKRETLLTEVGHWAQAVLNALNVGDIKSESALHLKLREVMINYRAEAHKILEATQREVKP